MSKYVCSMCGFEYDEAVGYPELDIPAGTKWEDLPSDFRCPWCGAEKEEFYLKEEEINEKLVEEAKKLSKEINAEKVEKVTSQQEDYDTYVCSMCGFEYNEAEGYPELDIPAGTKWEDLPKDFRCPMCGAEKEEFYLKEKSKSNKVESKEEALDSAEDEYLEISRIKLSAICSNLARGYEKQYNEEGANLYYELANIFKKQAPTSKLKMNELLGRVNEDTEAFAKAKEVAESKGDRGALRSLVWAEKVNKMIGSLLNRAVRGEDFDKLNVYVCTICGFIFVGDKLPEVCPVCKVPNFKFERV